MPDTWDFDKNRPPSEDRAPGPPILTRVIALLCVLLTLANQTSEMAKGTWWEAIGRFGFREASAIWDGHYTALLTSVFVHGSPSSITGTIMHLGFNMMWLMTLGTVLEMTLNPLQWALFFISAAVVASGAELAAAGQTGVGASGVVYAMFGLMWAGRRQYPEWRAVATPHNLNIFVMWGIFCVIATWAGALRIANAAHGGGFLFGLAVGWLLFDKKLRLLGAISLAALFTITILSVTWMPWSGDWCFWKGNREYRRQNYEAAIGWYRRAIRLGEDPEAALTNIAQAERLRGNESAAESIEKDLKNSTEQPAPQ